ncbi:hypothetical protein [Breoghania sp.]|uniref:hypothetical protein n=1 Tax=Breoghania sp. TaxID=2065378 RepID=UPI0026064B25|nr:hypothetical protein [Breoghania sp.]MDJ0929569.1 hypothetical protein [Breoghania sp.]
MSTATAPAFDEAIPVDAKDRSAPFRLRVYDSFEEIEPIWRALEADAAMPAYQGFRWLELWYRHVGLREVSRLVLVAGYRGETPVFI